VLESLKQENVKDFDKEREAERVLGMITGEQCYGVKNISTDKITVKQKQLTNCFPSSFLSTLLTAPLNYLNGIMLLHILFSIVLHRSKVAFAGTAHPHFKDHSQAANTTVGLQTNELIVGRTPYSPRVRA